MKKNLKYALLILLVLPFACDKYEESSLAILEEFAIKELPEIAFPIGEDNRIEAMVPDETDLSSLTATFSISPMAKMFIDNKLQISDTTKNDFNNTIVYTVVAEDGTSNDYKVQINSDVQLRHFAIIELKDTIFNIDGENITATVQNGTDLKNLTAIFEISSNAKLYVGDVEQVSGETSNNFEQSLIYTLKSDFDLEKTYTVTISKTENQVPTANAGENKTYNIAQGSTTTTVTLNGSLSEDIDGEIVDYNWQTNETTIASTEIAEVELQEGTHTITLTVTDNDGASASDERIITVLAPASNFIPVDDDAAQATKNLLANLGGVGNSSQFIFGQEFPLSFKQKSLSYNLSTSDCKDVTGDHPGVYGIDPHYMMYKSAKQRQLHIDEAKKAYENGSVVTFDFHQRSKTDKKIYMRDITTATDKSLMYDIVHDKNDARNWFFNEIDDIIGIINNDLGFPIIFRLFHEMGGNWFWWGSKATNHSTQLYIDFYKLTADYIKERTNLVLFSWAPNGGVIEEYYPGDNYVDVIGFDTYEPNRFGLALSLIELSKFAENHNKVAALTETGHRNDYINTNPGFWNDVVLAAIKDSGDDIKIAWVLAWFNAPWTSGQEELFIPNSESPQNAKDEFVQFKNDNITLFEEDVKALKMYD